MFCVECGNKMPDGVAFCSQCGAKMMNPQHESFTQQEGSNTQLQESKVAKILSENTRAKIKQFGLKEQNSASYYFENDISSYYSNSSNDESISCCLYLFDTGFLMSSITPFTFCGRKFGYKPGGIEFLYSDIAEIKKSKLGGIEIYTKDRNRHRFNGPKKLYDLLLQKMNTAVTTETFISPEYIINKSKMGEPMHNLYKYMHMVANFCWIFGVLILVVAFSNDLGDDVGYEFRLIMILFLYGFNLVVTFLEANELKSRGISNGVINLLDILITPMYLYKRDKLLNRNNNILIIWSVLLIVFLGILVLV